MARARLLDKMARAPNKDPTRKVQPNLPAEAYACLERLAEMGRYGSNPTEVARYLILREIDDMTRAGLLPLHERK
jgi:hypothetical protein